MSEVTDGRNLERLLDCRAGWGAVISPGVQEASTSGYFLAFISRKEMEECVLSPPSPNQGYKRVILQGARRAHAGHSFLGFALLPAYPRKADIYLILVVVLTVYSRKHCMLAEDICFQAAYAKLQ